MRQPVADRRHAGGELGVVHQRRRLRVGEEVLEFVFHVAIAHVERRHSGAVAVDHGLEVLIAVSQVQTEVVLSRLVPSQLVTLGVAAQSGGDEVVGATPSTRASASA